MKIGIVARYFIMLTCVALVVAKASVTEESGKGNKKLKTGKLCWGGSCTDMYTAAPATLPPSVPVAMKMYRHRMKVPKKGPVMNAPKRGPVTDVPKKTPAMKTNNKKGPRVMKMMTTTKMQMMMMMKMKMMNMKMMNMKKMNPRQMRPQANTKRNMHMKPANNRRKKSAPTQRARATY